MQNIRAVWPCLVKPGQRCFETLAQLALLQATPARLVVGAAIPHVPGRCNDWADDLSRGGWPNSAIALKVAYASALRAQQCQAEAFSCVRCMRPAPGAFGSCLRHCLASLLSLYTRVPNCHNIAATDPRSGNDLVLRRISSPELLLQPRRCNVTHPCLVASLLHGELFFAGGV